MKKSTLSAVVSRLVVVGLACGATACSTTGKKNEAIAKGATIGALSGAALGGGVGAIVGSTSGHLGEGVAVGALAGGVAGAGLGAAVGDYRAKHASRADSVADQDNQFQEQRKDLNSVKDSLGDDIGLNSSHSSSIKTSSLGVGSPRGSAYGSSSSSGSGSGFGAGKTGTSYGIMEGYHGNPRAKAFRPAPGTAIPASVMASRRGASSSQVAKVQWNSGKTESRARLAEANTMPASSRVANKVSSGTSYQDNGVRKIDNDLLARESGEDLDAISEPPVRKVTQSGAVVTQKSITSAVTSERAHVAGTISSGAGLGASESALAVAEKSAMEAKPAIDAKSDGTVVAKQLGKLPADSSASCIQAEKEAARATNATSDADRLFYLGRASRLCPTSDTYQVELGKVFAKIGKTQEAKNAFRKASDLNPQNDVARDELSILENSAQ